MGLPATNFFYLILQGGFELPRIEFPYLGTRGLTGIVMLTHIFFATLFVGYAVGSPLLQYFSVRTGNPQMARLAHSMARFNILTFSVGATFAVMFLVVLVGFYPRVTAALFVHFFWFFPVIAMTAMLLTLWLFYVHYYRAQNRARPVNIAAGLAAAFFILVWQTILTGIDTFMVTGGPAGDPATQEGTGISDIGSALYSLYNPTFIWQNLHRIFGNLSWPAFAVAAWAAFSYRQAKSAEDKAFYDWAGSMGVIWGTVFLLLQPFAGFAIAYAMKLGSSGPYERLTGSEGATFTSHLLWVNLLMVVALFVLANVAMYMGAQRHPDLAGQRPIRFFGLVAALAGLYAISPLADFPHFYARYVMILIMVLATVGALVAYIRGRSQFSYGTPSGGYRTILLSLGALAAVVTLSMGWMKSNSRVPYTIYGQPEYRVDSETPVTPEQFNQETPRVLGTPRSEETPKAKEG
jgi:cytochrome bd ubiquinol oxidase subunit I